ncbi:efflux RND transporter periplasmic adaptor subunit [Fontimonas sp. SYSU GA230001]|uniref:efflux RND transporter periplasmic adaptor subunit n=1 Tax=Fontimonas sp. SYSU GA230001 TaxID=3142450 RepID=UPI0032B5AFA3
MNPRHRALWLILCLTACSGGHAPSAESARAAPADAVPVEVQRVAPGAVREELTAVGSLRADESVVVRPEIAGRIVRIGFTEGQAVARGQLLFELDDAVQRAEVDQARANLQLAQRSFDRAGELYGRQLLSQSDRDQAAASRDQAAATLALAQARLDKTRIVAPFAGIAGIRLVSPGDYVAAGQDLVNLESMQSLKVDFRVDESALPRIAAGQKIEVEVDAYPRRRFEGEVYAIDPRIADATRSLALRARLPNPGGELRPGQFARIRLAVAQRQDAVVVPEQAIFPRGDRLFVYVVESGSARLREVRVGQRSPGQAEIVEGLAVGETLVVTGLQRLGDGTPVKDN